jgi:DNA (cytosine-5)-methyltransferase 1
MRDRTMTHGSLFSGIGGFELGAEWAGIPTLWNCEIEDYQREVLKKNFPNVKQYRDITKTSGLGHVDIISGGFPCQDISVAGKGEGITGKRSGLWTEMHRVIREVRPAYVIIENSPALLYRGFERVLCDLSESGYNAEWQCIRNSSFGFPHHRERLYVIAYTNEIGSQGNVRVDRCFKPVFKEWTPNSDDGYSCAKRIQQMPTCSHIRNGDGFPGWTHRVGSIGNAVNPCVAKYLFECIKEFDRQVETN